MPKRLVVADSGPLNYLVLIEAIDVLPRLFEQLDCGVHTRRGFLQDPIGTNVETLPREVMRRALCAHELSDPRQIKWVPSPLRTQHFVSPTRRSCHGYRFVLPFPVPMEEISVLLNRVTLGQGDTLGLGLHSKINIGIDEQPRDPIVFQQQSIRHLYQFQS
jgi:hypothetical protein